MASVRPAYYYNYGSAAPQRQPQPRVAQPQPRVTVIGGRGRADAASGDAILNIGKVVLALLVIFTVLGFARVALSSATVNAAIVNQQVSSDIDSARAAGNMLEVQESKLSNATYLKDYAEKKLGMAAPSEVETLVLGADIVAVDEEGNLSLSQSLAVSSAG